MTNQMTIEELRAILKVGDKLSSKSNTYTVSKISDKSVWTNFNDEKYNIRQSWASMVRRINGGLDLYIMN